MAVLALTANAQQYDPESDFSAKIINNGRGVEIIKYVGSKQTVNIPPTFEGIPVTSIGERAFVECTSLTRITIPNSVTSIGDSAFIDCTSLTGVTIPNSVTSIGDGAFVGCTGLTGITIPDSVTSIGSSAFIGCTSLISVTFQSANISISFYAAFNGDLKDKYRAGGAGTYKTTAPVGEKSAWTKQ